MCFDVLNVVYGSEAICSQPPKPIALYQTSNHWEVRQADQSCQSKTFRDA